MIRSFKTFSGTHICVLFLLMLGFNVSAYATNLTGTFKNPDGTSVNGKIIFLLSQPTRLNDQSAQIVPMVRIFSVANGALEAGAFVYGNDVLVPSGTYYLVRLVDSNNNLLFEQKWSITGVNLNLGTLTPTTIGVVFADPLIKNLSTDQAVQGPVSFSAPISAFSLTLNGNLNPGAPDSYDLGSSTAPWQELHAIRWNPWFTVGTSGGTAAAPAAPPGATVVLSGGSIADGTYYCKTTYKNRNGETTASPTKTLAVTGGGGAAKVYTAPGDTHWMTGTYGFRTYCSNDNVNFYLQTPNPVVADFMADATTHYVTMGSNGARFTSFTFSGTIPPTTNTATIDPLQVALNATRASAAGPLAQYTSIGTLVVPAATNAQTAWIMTTPLIVKKNDKIIGSASANGLVNVQSRIYASWTDPQLAALMSFGADFHVEGVGIQGVGTNAVMILGGVGNQGGNSGRTIFLNNALRVNNTNVNSAVVLVGINYDMDFTQNSIQCGLSCIEYRNAAGGIHTFNGGRWDGGGEHFVFSKVGWTDPDDGANSTAFRNAVSRVTVKNVRTENGTGISWDVRNINLTLDSVETADTLIGVGTDSIVRTGATAESAGEAGNQLTIINCNPGTSANARVGTMVWGGTLNAMNITLIGKAALGNGTSTGVSIGLDANSIPLYLTGSVSSNSSEFTLNPTLGSTGSVRAINLHDNTKAAYFGGGRNLTNEDTWNEIAGRVVIVPFTGTNNVFSRAARMTLYNNNGATFSLLKSDDATYLWQSTHSNGNFDIRGNLRVQATGGASPQLFVGSSASTATSGSIGLVNQGNVLMRNAAGSADVRLVAGDSSDRVIVGDTAGVCLSTSTNCAPIKGNLSATATLDFPSTAISVCSDLTLNVTGAAIGDPVFLGVPNASVPAGGWFFAWVSAANMVTIRFCADGTARDPASASFRATVVKF